MFTQIHICSGLSAFELTESTVHLAIQGLTSPLHYPGDLTNNQNPTRLRNVEGVGEAGPVFISENLSSWTS